MLNSVLLYLEEPSQAGAVIRLGVSAAQRAGARVRGLTLVDTRWLTATHQCESAASAVMAQHECEVVERGHAAICEELARACLAAEVNFDVRRASGDPVEVLAKESHFHDVVIASVTDSSSLTLQATLRLLEHGVQPLLVMPPEQSSIERVLMVYDGSEAAGRAIRSYLGTGMGRGADHRLLAVGRDADSARAALREMADYCGSRCERLELGCAAGRPRRVVAPYAAKWQADMLVLGVGMRAPILRRLLGDPAATAWNTLRCSLFVTA